MGEGTTTLELERAVQVLAHGLNDEDRDDRIACAEALAYIGPNARDASAALVKMFEAGDSKEKIFVCQAFGAIGPCPSAPQSVQALIEGLTSQDAKLPEWVADALGGIGSQAAIAAPTLVSLLTDNRERVRESAVRALARIGNVPDAAGAQLRAMLIETNLGVRAGAAVALLRLDPTYAPAILAVKECLTPDKPAVERSGTVYLFMASKPLAELFLPDLQRLLKDPDINVVDFTRRALNQMGRKPVS